ncbi:probable E3 ubiquitin-protein ligase HERC4 [Corticium candelabrum]|uniref:probable E3 ubiquitin-protein ligase HERC4 n=1 Tax=Corticium candelabrum TaxID=121492 RepID=UPI002E263DDB|nr:probable E3 ubiquitin-protein ligase HERC4 [Corticium candelabrum]
MSVFGFGYNGFRQICQDDCFLKNLPVFTGLLFNTSNTKLALSWSTSFAVTEEEDVSVWGWTNDGSKSKSWISKLVVPGYGHCRWTDATCPCGSGGMEKLVLYSRKDKLLLWLTECDAESKVCGSSNRLVGKVDLSPAAEICSIACNREQIWASDGNGAVFTSCFSPVSVTSKIAEETNDNSQIVSSTVKPVSLQRLVSFSHRVVQVACGIDHTILLTATGVVYSCGIGSRGQLGLGDIKTHTTPQVIDLLGGINVIRISTGGWHSLALTDLGSVYSWGWNSSGQLGVSGDGKEDSNDSIGKFGAFPEMVDFPLECDIVQLACGSRHSAAVTRDGLLFTWGWGAYGQLGHGDTSNKICPTIVQKLKDDGLFVASVCCGSWHTLTITKNLGHGCSSADSTSLDL